MYARISFRGAQTYKIGKKSRVFLVIVTNFGKGHDGQIKKNAWKNTY